MKKLLAIFMTSVLSSCFTFPNFQESETIYESNHYCHQSACENIIFPNLLVENTHESARVLEPINPINPNDPIINSIPSYYRPNRLFTYNYFKNLRSNMFDNRSHSVGNGFKHTIAKCPFVLIAMYFSYLDIYWNDAIIDNNYQGNVILNDYNDVDFPFESPGINDNHDLSYVGMNEQDKLSEEEINNLIRNYIDTSEYYSNNSYLAYLVFLANRINLFPNGTLTSLGLTLNPILSLINEVINDSEILRNNATLHCYTADSFDNYEDFESILINKLVLGEPVMIGVPGHVMIAYDYIDGEIIVNKGYKGTHTCDTLEDPITDFYFLELSDSIPHIHNSLYTNNNSTSFFNRTYCSCELMSHSHMYNYVHHNDVNHKKQCFCETFASQENHIFTHTEHIGLHEYVICEYCNYAKLIDDNFEPIV